MWKKLRITYRLGAAPRPAPGRGRGPASCCARGSRREGWGPLGQGSGVERPRLPGRKLGWRVGDSGDRILPVFQQNAVRLPDPFSSRTEGKVGHFGFPHPPPTLSFQMSEENTLTLMRALWRPLLHLCSVNAQFQFVFEATVMLKFNC